MELRDFVKDTLIAIIGGVKDAQNGDLGSHINPPYSSLGDKAGLYVTEDERLANPVKFDVAVTVTDSGAVEGGGKISILSVGVGGKASSANQESTVTRIQFEVPITLPRPQGG